jgi:NCAIR mutase (PurE)-related protein
MDSEILLDHGRQERIGFGEAILCQGKSVQQIEAILADGSDCGAALFLTRLDAENHGALDAGMRSQIDYDPVSRTGFFNREPAQPRHSGVCIVTAGTSDIPVAREAERTLAFNHFAPELVFDIGVAGLWRLTERAGDIARHKAVIAIAGMDAALPTVLAGLVPGLVIGVPTSTGYGAARGGETALMAMLASCAPGLVTVNIDNGYGAACAAMRALQSAGKGLAP